MRTLSIVGLLCALPAPMVAAQGEVFTQGVVVSDHPIASEAGAAMLARGGNAVDAAIATSFALSVVRPMSCGIGGGGFMLVHDPGAAPEERNIAIDYRETAPAAVGPMFFVDLNDPEASTITGAAVGTPGTVAGMWAAHQRFGSLPWRELLQPAIAAAEEGFVVNDDSMSSAEEMIAWYEESPARKERYPYVWRRFLREGAVRVGDRITNPEQAKALRLIAEHGPDGFYRGAVAEAIVRAVASSGGVLSTDDLEGYEVRARTPLEGDFYGRRVVVMPPPSSGGVATLQALQAIEALDERASLAELGHNSATTVHILAEVFKHVFADRSRWLGDTDFVEAPIDELLSPAHIQSIAARIDLDGVQKQGGYGRDGGAPITDDAGTSHFSVIDASGMAVACTETINLTFGSRIAVDEFGFCLNNEMDDFTTISGAANAFGLRQPDLNLPEAGKRPISSMSPTIVLGPDGRVELVTGARGGPRIITAVIQSIVNALVFEMSAPEAVSAPRAHHQLFPPFLALEPGLLNPASTETNPTPEEMLRMFDSVSSTREFQSQLRSKGHLFGEMKTVGVVELLRRSGDGYEAGADPRGGGAAAGLPRTKFVETGEE